MSTDVQMNPNWLKQDLTRLNKLIDDAKRWEGGPTIQITDAEIDAILAEAGKVQRAYVDALVASGATIYEYGPGYAPGLYEVMQDLFDSTEHLRNDLELRPSGPILQDAPAPIQMDRSVTEKVKDFLSTTSVDAKVSPGISEQVYELANELVIGSSPMSADGTIEVNLRGVYQGDIITGGSVKVDVKKGETPDQVVEKFYQQVPFGLSAKLERREGGALVIKFL